jgi:FkbH-like protein
MKIDESPKILLVSDFTINNMAGYLNNDDDFPTVKASVSPYGQVIQVLLNDNLDCWQNNPDFVVVWTQPENIINSFRPLLDFHKVDIQKILDDIDEFSKLLINVSRRVKHVFVSTWVLPSYYKIFKTLDMKNEIGVSNVLMRMNIRLLDNLADIQNICMLNAQRWIEVAGVSSFNPKLWYTAKIAFGNEVFKEAAKDIKNVIRGFLGMAKKLIILDLDDTLWGGIVGDDGWENIKLGGHDPIGEAYVDFQRALKSLTNRGILLGMVSKNDEKIALEAITKHPEMILKLEDFVGWKINWEDKAKNILELVSELNLGLQSVVFIDDNPYERARVSEALPEVFVPEWPQDKMLYKSALLSLRCFEISAISDEDIMRTKLYVVERQRGELKEKIGSIDEWLKTLAVKVEVEVLNNLNLPRTVQLLNKTNQMNLSTRRMTEAELIDWARQEQRKVWIIRASDKFGDLGLVGIVSIEVNNNIGCITDFILSCRAMGRKIEEIMVLTTANYARTLKLDKIIAKYVPTAKNKPCLEFWKSSGFKYEESEAFFEWDLQDDYPSVNHVEVIYV